VNESLLDLSGHPHDSNYFFFFKSIDFKFLQIVPSTEIGLGSAPLLLRTLTKAIRFNDLFRGGINIIVSNR